MNQRNIFTNNGNYLEPEDEGILAKTGNMISSFFVKVRNSINPFKEKSYAQNPYDINAVNDPSNFLNYIESTKDNFYYSPSSFQNENNQFYEKGIKRNNNNNIIINNNQKENLNKEENEYFPIEYLCNIYPNLKKEIFKDFKKPSYMPNEQVFQEAKKFVYENLVNKYQILKPKSELNNFIESTIILSIQLVNKYNIDKHYEYLINNKKCEYKLIINVPEILKNYYGNKEKDLLKNDMNMSSLTIKNDVNKEIFNKFSLKENNKDDTFNIINENENRIICQTPKAKRNYIKTILNAKENFEYLGEKDKMIISIFYDCLLHREEELRRYEKVVETTNNMFKFICNENEKLKDEVAQKDKKLEKFSQEIILKDFKNKDYEQQIKNYKNELKDLKKKNKFENLIKTHSISNSYINNKKSSQSSQANPNHFILFGLQSNQGNNLNNNSIEKNSISKNKSFESNNKFSENENTLKRAFDPNNNSSFTFGNKKEINSNERNIFSNNTNSGSSQQFLEKEKIVNNNKDPSFVLNLSNNQTQNLLDSKIKKQKDETKENKISILESTEKKNEVKQNEEKTEINKKKETPNEYNIFSSIVSDIKSNSNKSNDEKKTNNIFLSDSNNNDKIIFGFKENGNKNKNKEDEKNQNIEIKSVNIKGFMENNEINKINESEKIERNIEIIKTGKKEEKRENQDKKEENNIISYKEGSLNNPNNPFLSTAEVRTNIKPEFSLNALKDDKEKNNNIIQNEERSTIDNTNIILDSNENQSFNNSIGNNNIFIQNKTDTVNFLNNNKIEEKISINNNSLFSENPFLSKKTVDDNTKNTNNINNQNINSTNNSSHNINIFSNITTTSTPNNNQSIFQNQSDSNNAQNNNPFLTGINNNPFIQNNANINNNDSSNKYLFSSQLQTQNNISNNNNQNPFISNMNNPFNTNNNSININPFTLNNNVNNANSSNINPFIGNNNTNNISSTSSNINPFIGNNSTINTASTSSNINPFITTSNLNLNNNSNPFAVNNNISSSENPFNPNNNNNSSSNINPFIGNNNNSTNINPFNGNNNLSSNISQNNVNNGNSEPLFKFQINAEQTNQNINPFLNCQDGFKFGGADSSCGFSLGVKSNNNDNSNKSLFSFEGKKIQGFYK